MHDSSLPIESDSQEIGRLAEKAYAATSPISWIASPTGGSADFGIDYTIELKNVDNQVFGSFFLQLKGTKSPNIISNGKAISMQFDTSTLNFYRNLESAVMVAVVDLSVSNSPKNCPIYYKWLDEDFLDSISERREKNDKVSIQISKSETITEDLDINPIHFARLSIRETLIDFRRAIETHSTTPMVDIENITNTIKEKPIFLAAVKDDVGAPWINNPETHAAGKLKKLSDAVNTNQISEIISLINEIEAFNDLSAHENAEFLSLRGIHSSLQGDENNGHLLQKDAFNAFPESRYKINYFESEFCLEELPSEERLQYFISQVGDLNYRESVFKAKCLAILGKEKDATTVLDKYPDEKTIISRLMVFTLCQNSSSFDEVVLSADITSFNSIKKMMFHALVGRKLFFEGTNYEISDYRELPIPSKGKPSYDFPKLKEAYFHIKEGLKYGKEQNYPHDIFLLTDVAVPLYGFFNDEKKLIAYLNNILDLRSISPQILSHLIVLNFNIHNYSEVIKLSTRLKEKNVAHLSALIVANYHEQNKNTVMRLVDENKPLLLENPTQNIASIFCMAAQCAYEMLDDAKEADYLALVHSLDFKDLIAVYQFIKSCNANPHQRKEFHVKLYNDYISLGRPASLAYQLFPHLNVQDVTEAEWICDLANSILKIRELYPEEATTYAFALILQEQWAKLEELCMRVEQHGNSNNLWALFRAVAVESLGRSGEALNILDAGLSNDKRSLERAENYVNLCVRLGLFDKAEEKLIHFLEKSSRKKQYSILELLIFIYSSETGQSEKLYKTLSRYGSLADQNDEYQEGKYLCSYLLHTNKPDFDDSNREEFRERLSRYIKRFPNSKVIRFGNVESEDGSLNIKELWRLAGITEEKRAAWNKNRNLMRTQKLAIPYAMRPVLLDNVGDIFVLWVYGKHTEKELAEYKLPHSTTYKLARAEEIDPSKKIVVDETSLIVLYELDLLDSFLNAFSNIVINKSSYQLLSRLSHATMGSAFSAMPKGILEVLKKYIPKLIIAGSVDPGKMLITQYVELIEQNNCSIILTEDAYIAGFLRHGRAQLEVINAVNIVEHFVRSSVVSIEAGSALIEKFCSLPIIEPSLSFDHVTNSLLFNLNNKEKYFILDSGFKYIFDAIFGLSKTQKSAFSLICAIFVNFLNVTRSEKEITPLSEIISVWMVRYPGEYKLVFLSRWFVSCCVQVDYVKESELVERGKGQYRMWELMKHLTIERGDDINITHLIAAVCDRIIDLNATLASEAYDLVKKAFIEDSHEYNLFSEIYTRKAISKRLSEVQ